MEQRLLPSWVFYWLSNAMNIFLIRHTEYENPDKLFAGRLPFPLSQEGREHAKRIGKWFLENGYLKLPIYSSPVKRTVETAEIIAEQTKSSIKQDTRLIEREMSCEGKSHPKTGPIEYAYSSYFVESIEHVLDRVKPFYNERISEGKDCIIVSHGDPLTSLFYLLIDKVIPNSWEDPLYVQKGEILWVKYDYFKKLQHVERIQV